MESRLDSAGASGVCVRVPPIGCIRGLDAGVCPLKAGVCPCPCPGVLNARGASCAPLSYPIEAPIAEAPVPTAAVSTTGGLDAVDGGEADLPVVMAGGGVASNRESDIGERERGRDREREKREREGRER